MKGIFFSRKAPCLTKSQMPRLRSNGNYKIRIKIIEVAFDLQDVHRVWKYR